MSDYKILHKRAAGIDRWQVFYQERPLIFYSGMVTKGDRCAENPYSSLDHAKKIIEAHKEHVEWLKENAERLERAKKEDITEWLDEDGVVIPPNKNFRSQEMTVAPADSSPKDWVWAAILVIAATALAFSIFQL